MSENNQIIIETNNAPQFSVIWLHGLGADGNDFVPIIDELRIPEEIAVRFVFPHAPIMPVTVNGGHEMRAWYDIKMADLMKVPDLAGIDKSVATLLSLIKVENNKGIATDKIILAGFSQGGVIALSAALQMKEKPLGVMALSTYLAEKKLAEAGDLNVFQGHGVEDEIIPLSVAVETRDYLISLGIKVDWHEYKMGHSVVPQEINDIRKWLVAAWKIND